MRSIKRVAKIRVYPMHPGRERDIGLTTIIEPYWEGIAWYSGLPVICTHENVKWDNDFYACSDGGTCEACGGRLSRSCHNLDRDSMGYAYENAERVAVPASRLAS